MASFRPVEVLATPMLKDGPLLTQANSSVSQWAGRSVISSGSSSVTVSTQMVNSDTIITWGVEFNTTVSSGQTNSVRVSTISPLTFFTFATHDGQNVAQDVTVMWMAHPTSDPS